jgi:hypothetical protein
VPRVRSLKNDLLCYLLVAIQFLEEALASKFTYYLGPAGVALTTAEGGSRREEEIWWVLHVSIGK